MEDLEFITNFEDYDEYDNFKIQQEYYEEEF